MGVRVSPARRRVEESAAGLSLFVVVGLGLTALALWAGWWTGLRDPTEACPGARSMVALELAGDAGAAGRIVEGWRTCGGVEFARSALRRDTVAFIPAYAVALAWWVQYSRWFSHRHKVRRVAGRVQLGVAIAAAADLVENAMLSRVLDDPVRGADITVATGASLLKWLLVVVALVFAFAALASSLSRWFRRLVVGEAAYPTFLPRRASLAEPLPPLRPDGDDEGGRRARRLQDPDGRERAPGAVGIALSGGGIRAASFALGALQALQAAPLDPSRPDGPSLYSGARYLSTVSGGGYTGTATQILAHQTEGEARQPFAAGSEEAAFVREHRRFLWGPPLAGRRAQSSRDFVTGVAVAFVGIAFNVLLVVGLLFLLARPVGWLARESLFAELPAREGSATGLPWRRMTGGLWLGWLLCWAALGWLLVPYVRKPHHSRVAVYTIAAVVALVLTTIAVGSLRFGLSRRWWAFLVPLVVGAVAALAGLLGRVAGRYRGSIPKLAIAFFLVGIGAALFARWAHAAFVRGPDGPVSPYFLLLVGSIATGMVVAVLVAAAARVVLERRRGSVPAARLVATGLVAALVGGLGAGWVTYLLVTPEAAGVEMATDRRLWAAVAVLLAAVYLFVDQKRWSPHPIYKKRLSSAFALTLDDAGKAHRLPYRIGTTLSEWSRRAPDHPELLVCGAVYDSVERRDGEVRAWPFVFGAQHVGGPDVGWMRTVDFEAALGRTNGGDGTLLAAMAVSGAAVSPAIGQINLGAWNALVAVFNARLGVWLPNPRYVASLRDTSFAAPTWLRTRRFTYLLKEILGSYDLDDRFVYVTDGGQLDNLGLLELLQRRCTTIVCVDASGDNAPGATLDTATFDNVRELARRRLGVVFGPPGGPWDGRRPSGADPGEPVMPGRLTGPLIRRRGETAPATWARGSEMPPVESLAVKLAFQYPDGVPGTLVLAKAVLAEGVGTDPGGDAAGDEADDRRAIARYLGSGEGARRFPAHSTVDQWLDRDQFDAYVALGRHAGRAAVAHLRA
jgi:hypothetical protein